MGFSSGMQRFNGVIMGSYYEDLYGRFLSHGGTPGIIQSS